jgi:hypothetical protein
MFDRFLVLVGIVGLVLACNESNYWEVNVLGVMLLATSVALFNFKS